MASSYFVWPAVPSVVSGGATAANQVLEIADLDAINTAAAAINTKTPALGQALAAGSVPVVLTAAQLTTLTPLSSVTVSGTVAATQSGTWNITNVSGTVSLPTGAATETTVAAINTKTPALGQALAASSVPVVLTAAQLTTLTPLTTVAVTNTGTFVVQATLAAETTKVIGTVNVAAAQSIAATQSGTWTVQPGNTANTTAWLVTEAKASTATLTNVASSASSVSVLASAATRKQAMFFNESTAVLYLKFGTTASATSYTVQIPSNGYYELPSGSPYTGAIDGIWSAANGNVRVTELT